MQLGSEMGENLHDDQVNVNEDAFFDGFSNKIIELGLIRKPSELEGLRILQVADIGGGKVYEGKNNMIGLAHLLKGLRAEEMPDLFIVNGGALPYIPPKIRKKKDKLNALQNGVNELNDAAAVVKPSIERLLNRLPNSTAVIYVLNEEDRQNIEELSDILVYDFKAQQDKLLERITRVTSEIKAKKTIIWGMDKSKAEYEKKLEELKTNGLESNGNGNKAATINKKLENIERKTYMTKSEIDDLNKQYVMLENVFINSLDYTSNEKFIKRAIKETTKALHRINGTGKNHDSGDKELLTKRLKALEKRLEELDITNEIKYTERKLKNAASDQERRKLANGLRALHKRLDEMIGGEERMARERRFRQAYRFTGQVYIEADMAKGIENLAVEIYKGHIKDAFGRKREIVILDENITPVRVSKIEASDGGDGNAKYRSFTIAKKEIDPLAKFTKSVEGNSNKGYNVLIAHSLTNTSYMFKKSSVDEAQKVIYRLYEAINFEPNIVISGHNALTMFKPVLFEKTQSRVWYWNQGPFIDPQLAYNAWNKGIKDTYTEGFQRRMDYSASMMTINGKGIVSLDNINYKELAKERIADDIEEGKNIDISRFKKTDEGTAEGVGEKPNLEAAIIRSRRPSELRERELAQVTPEKISALIPYSSVELNGYANVKLSMVSDLHIGGKPNYKVIIAMLTRIRNENPDIFVIGGDVIEGDHKSFKYDPDIRYTKQTFDEYTEMLKKSGLSEGEVLAEQEKYLERYLYSTPEYNIDNQMRDKLMRGLIDVSAELVNKGKYVVVVAGNHYNNTFQGLKLDEAIRIAAAIEDKVSEEYKDHIKIVSGGEYGAGELYISINGKLTPIFFTHKLARSISKGEDLLDKQERDADLVISGHYHRFEISAQGERWEVKIPSGQDPDNQAYLETISERMAKNLNGYLNLHIKIDSGTGRIVKTTVEPILQDDLIALKLLERDERWEQFKRLQRSMRLDEANTSVAVAEVKDKKNGNGNGKVKA